MLASCAGVCCGEHGGQLLNGQSFLCVTLGADALTAAARLLRTPHIFIYDAAVPDALGAHAAAPPARGPATGPAPSGGGGGADGGGGGAVTGGQQDPESGGGGNLRRADRGASPGPSAPLRPSRRGAADAGGSRENRTDADSSAVSAWAGAAGVARAMAELAAPASGEGAGAPRTLPVCSQGRSSCSHPSFTQCLYTERLFTCIQ